MLLFLLRGLAIGLLFGVPVGAVGALALERALRGSFWHGFVTGLGSSTADVFYACVGLCGLTAVSSFLQNYAVPVRAAGSILMAIYGLCMIFRAKAVRSAKAGHRAGSYAAEYFSALILALLNPAAVLSFLVAFSIFGVAEGCDFVDGCGLVLGILLGTGAWWSALSFAARHLQSRITPRAFCVIQRVLGGAMLIFAIVFLAQSL